MNTIYHFYMILFVFICSIQCHFNNRNPSYSLFKAAHAPRQPKILTRMQRLEHFKKNFLKKLQLTTPPEVTNRFIPNSPSLRSQIKQIEESSVQLNETDDAKSLLVKSQSVSGKPITIFFNLSSINISSISNIEYANISIYVKKEENTHAFRRTVLFVYDANNTELLARHEIPYGELETWVYIDFTTKIKDWLTRPESNYGIEVICTDNRGNALAILNNKDERYVSNAPILEIKVSNDVRRTKRDITNFCIGSCCRYPLKVDFQELGWDYVVAPKALTIYSCLGECRGDDTYSKVSSKQLCCVPKSYSSFSIVYFDVLGNIMVGEVPGIITQKCSCIRDQ